MSLCGALRTNARENCSARAILVASGSAAPSDRGARDARREAADRCRRRSAEPAADAPPASGRSVRDADVDAAQMALGERFFLAIAKSRPYSESAFGRRRKFFAAGSDDTECERRRRRAVDDRE
jgi:hypothetical protein